jgi:hypothetical protein
LPIAKETLRDTKCSYLVSSKSFSHDNLY